MGHKRKRTLTNIILSDLSWSPIVGVFGLRQTGKTTLLETISKIRGGQYFSLDDEAILASAQTAPQAFLSTAGLLCLDEVQKAPELFPAMKSSVGTKREPGRFLLTGSVRFTALEAVKESLTGRVILHELLPFSVSEIHHLPPSRFLEQLVECREDEINPFFQNLRKISPTFRVSEKMIHTHAERGGLPIPCFMHDRGKRTQWFQAYFQTLLTRDVAMVHRGLRDLSFRLSLLFLRALSQAQGHEVTISDLSKQSGLSFGISKRLLQALETLALIDRIPPLALGKKSVKKLRIEWKDTGLWLHASGYTLTDQTSHEPLLALSLSQEFRHQISFFQPTPHWRHYRSLDGAKIPWIFESKKRQVAITFIFEETPKPYSYRALRHFIEKNPKSLGVILGRATTKIVPLHPRIWLVPYTAVY